MFFSVYRLLLKSAGKSVLVNNMLGGLGAVFTMGWRTRSVVCEDFMPQKGIALSTPGHAGSEVVQPNRMASMMACSQDSVEKIDRLSKLHHHDCQDFDPGALQISHAVVSAKLVQPGSGVAMRSNFSSPSLYRAHSFGEVLRPYMAL